MLAAIVAVLVVACSPTESKGPPDSASPTGATPIPGGPMETTPTAASPKVPGSQQEAIDTVLGYLQRTVDGLPPGTELDSSDARGGANLSCDDDNTGSGSGPTEYVVATHVIAPAGVKPTDLIAKTGDLWRTWGAKVMQREGFEKPNQFGYPSDGYRVQIEAAYPANYPPLLTVVSPCFAGDLRQDGIPAPSAVIRQTNRGS